MNKSRKYTRILLQMARTQKNKATNAHLGILKAKLAKLRRELITPKGGGGPAQEGFDVAKTGDARIGFVGRKFSTWKRRNCWVLRVFLRRTWKFLAKKGRMRFFRIFFQSQINVDRELKKPRNRSNLNSGQIFNFFISVGARTNEIIRIFEK